MLRQQLRQVNFCEIGPAGPQCDQGVAEPNDRIGGILGGQPFIIGPGASSPRWPEFKFHSCGVQPGTAGQIARGVRGDRGSVMLKCRWIIS